MRERGERKHLNRISLKLLEEDEEEEDTFEVEDEGRSATMEEVVEGEKHRDAIVVPPQGFIWCFLSLLLQWRRGETKWVGF